MDSLLALFNSLPSPVQAFLLGMAIVVMLKLAIDGALALRRPLKNGDSLVLIAFNARYEERSIVITSNRAMEEWPEVFGDGLLASAALDRLTHHAETLIIRGQSYLQLERRKEASEGNKTKTETGSDTDFTTLQNSF